MFAAHTCVGPDERPRSSSGGRPDSESASSTSLTTGASGQFHKGGEAAGNAVVVSSWAVKKAGKRKTNRLLACFQASACADDSYCAEHDVNGLRTGSIFLDDGPQRPSRKEEHIMSTSKICDNALFEDD